MTDNHASTALQLEVKAPSDLLDHSPFREGTLTEAAEAYILKRVKDLPQHERVRIEIVLPSVGQSEPIPGLEAAFRDHFEKCAEAETRKLQEHFRTGRRALLIGVVTLSICLAIAFYISGLPQRPSTRVVQESFVILGWVSVWKPIEMFLYDWMPGARRRDLCRLLAAADVSVLPGH